MSYRSLVLTFGISAFMSAAILLPIPASAATGHDHDHAAESHQEEEHIGHDDHRANPDRERTDRLRDHAGESAVLDHNHHKDQPHESAVEGHGDEGEHDKHEGHAGHDDHGEEHAELLTLDAEARAMIRLQTEAAAPRRLGGVLRVYGKIARDTENYAYVTADDTGVIESIHTRPGDIVDRGDGLFTIRLTDGSTHTLTSEMHGTVMSVFVNPGERVDRLTSLLSIVDVDTMRATIDIYEKDLRHIRVGQKVILTTSAYPDRKFKGEVVYISPQVDEHTQSIKVRVDVDNPQHLLRLGMFVSGELIYAADKTALSVPIAALQQLSGEDVVFVAGQDDRLIMREVILGESSGGYTEIRQGLKEGEHVVTQGSFYLKSELAKESFGHGHAH